MWLFVSMYIDTTALNHSHSPQINEQPEEIYVNRSVHSISMDSFTSGPNMEQVCVGLESDALFSAGLDASLSTSLPSLPLVCCRIIPPLCILLMAARACASYAFGCLVTADGCKLVK